jgi:lactate permease
MYQQVYDPVAHSLGLTTIFAAIPLTLMFVMLGIFKRSPQLSALTSLVACLAVATLIYPMPLGVALNTGLFGVAFAVMTIGWILINAMWIYNMTVETGHFAVLRESFGRVSADLRIQAIIVAFCFGALIEALAGSGVPIAICSAMLVAIGFDPVRAAVMALVADTAPVAFGALAVPITTLHFVTDQPYATLGGSSAVSPSDRLLRAVCSRVHRRWPARLCERLGPLRSFAAWPLRSLSFLCRISFRRNSPT